MKIGDYTVEISHPDKILFPNAGYTKGDVIAYYLRIAEFMLPHVNGRPISMQRFPGGIQQPGFFQKEAPEFFPSWVDRVEINLKEEGGKQPQVVVNNAATLVYLANQAMITTHAWLSKADKLDYPDKMIFDLDPPDGNFGVVRDAALSLRNLLESIDLVPFVKTTGSRGLHVVVPIDRRADFQTVREFSRDVAEILARRQPNRLTTELSKEERNGRLFIDYLRNSYAQTVVAPYSLRAVANAPVSTPLEWDELSDPRLNAQRYNLQNIFRRLGQKKDPWEKMMQKAGSLVSARRQLDMLMRQS